MPEAGAVAQRVTGVRAVAARRLTGGESSTVDAVTLEDGRVVIVRRHADPSVYATTRRNLETLAGLGLPVPKVLGEAPGAVVLEKLPGRDLRFVLPTLTPSQMRTIAGQVAGFQRTVVARLPAGAGYGWVGIGETGPHATWKAAFGFDRQTDPRLRAAAATLEDHLDTVAPTCHLDDITGKNVLVGDDGALTGLVDFDGVCYGDPLFWLGLTAAGILADCGERELLYADALTDAFVGDARARRVVAFYSAWIAVEFVDRFAARESASWRARMEAGIARWLAEAVRA